MYGYCPLASGSKGNSIFVRSARAKILVDAGLTQKVTEERLNALGVSIGELDAILVTHEHSDHIAGLKKIAAQWQIPLYANSETAKGIVDALGFCPRFKIFTTGEPFAVGDVEIHPFSVQHDTLDPVAFTMRFDGVKLALCTDLGFATTVVQHHLQGCDYLYVEANHEPEMVHASARPPFLKQRILGRNGHLSNGDCAALLQKVAHSDLKHIYLAHLSGECNSPAKALSVVGGHLQRCGIAVPLAVAPQECSAPAIAFN